MNYLLSCTCVDRRRSNYFVQGTKYTITTTLNFTIDLLFQVLPDWLDSASRVVEELLRLAERLSGQLLLVPGRDLYLELPSGLSSA
jgi:hypothetical protein